MSKKHVSSVIPLHIAVAVDRYVPGARGTGKKRSVSNDKLLQDASERALRFHHRVVNEQRAELWKDAECYTPPPPYTKDEAAIDFLASQMMQDLRALGAFKSARGSK